LTETISTASYFDANRAQKQIQSDAKVTCIQKHSEYTKWSEQQVEDKNDDSCSDYTSSTYPSDTSDDGYIDHVAIRSVKSNKRFNQKSIPWRLTSKCAISHSLHNAPRTVSNYGPNTKQMDQYQYNAAAQIQQQQQNAMQCVYAKRPKPISIQKNNKICSFGRQPVLYKKRSNSADFGHGYQDNYNPMRPHIVPYNQHPIHHQPTIYKKRSNSVGDISEMEQQNRYNQRRARLQPQPQQIYYQHSKTY